MINIIVAVAKNHVIGKKNDLPWYLPEDLKHFKKITDGQTVLMGSKTFESIMTRLGKPLPNRKSLVITSNPSYAVPEGVLVYNDLEKALAGFKSDEFARSPASSGTTKQSNQKELFIIGGASIYKQTIDKVDKLYVTEVDQAIDGDAFFPEIDKSVWQEVSREPHQGFSFVEYQRKKL